MFVKIKSLFRNHPILSTLGSAVILFVAGYLILILKVLGPASMSKGRMNSYDKSWEEIEENIDLIKVGTSSDSVYLLLGKPDNSIVLGDTQLVLSYQQYGVIAPHWIYDVRVMNDTVIKVDSYDW